MPVSLAARGGSPSHRCLRARFRCTQCCDVLRRSGLYQAQPVDHKLLAVLTAASVVPELGNETDADLAPITIAIAGAKRDGEGHRDAVAAERTERRGISACRARPDHPGSSSAATPMRRRFSTTPVWMRSVLIRNSEALRTVSAFGGRRRARRARGFHRPRQWSRQIRRAAAQGECSMMISPTTWPLRLEFRDADLRAHARPAPRSASASTPRPTPRILSCGVVQQRRR